jgi:hypothetical protein
MAWLSRKVKQKILSRVACKPVAAKPVYGVNEKRMPKHPFSM